MKKTLILSTFNGAAYITEQLDSIRAQTSELDDVLIRDDCSSDMTPEIISSYIMQHALDRWSFTRSEHNLGWKKSYHDLAIHAKGDLLFFCDQDDIWLPEKVADMAKVMNNHPEIDVLACSVEPLYEQGSQRTNAGAEQASDLKKLIVPQGLDERAIYVQRPGCSYCIRMSFVREIMPYWRDDWAHDAVVWILSEVKGSLYLYNKRLMKFRRHNNNASSRKEISKESRIDDLSYQIEKVLLMERFGTSAGYLTAEKSSLLEELRCWLECRRECLMNRSFRALIGVLRGMRFYVSFGGFLVDMLLCFSKGAKRL